MKYFLSIIIISCLNSLLLANDGAFYAKGNQLIPIVETDIMVKKEILTIKKIKNDLIEVTVYYEFYNPSEEKNIIVGFEAFSPSGDVDGTPKNGQHPYMRDFTVNLNNQLLTYNIAYVEDSAYADNGVVKSLNLNQLNVENSNDVQFYYVYHFNAKFKKGLNVIQHTYKYDLSNSIEYNYDFEYVLTAANRWGNKQIDDFTLIIDMGEFETFNIDKYFFKESNEWLIEGIGKVQNIKSENNPSYYNDALKFHIQQGNIIFKKSNFKPAGELFLYARNDYNHQHEEQIPFSYYQQDRIGEPTNNLEKKILRNLPFARRGYVFTNPELKKYYEKIDWYIPSPSYIPTVDSLNEIEIEWINKWK